MAKKKKKMVKIPALQGRFEPNPNLESPYDEEGEGYIVSDSPALPTVPSILPDDPEEVPSGPGWAEVWTAGMELENPWVGGYARYTNLPTFEEFATQESYDVPEDFNPIENIEGYEEFHDRFALAQSPFEVAFLKRSIDRQRENRKVMDQSGLKGFAVGVAAGFLDPITFVPFGATSAALKGGSVLRRGLITAQSTALGMTATEALLQAQQETRTLGESASNISASALLSGVLGTGVAAFKDWRITRKIPKNITDDVERALTIPSDGTDFPGGDRISITRDDLSEGAALFQSVGAAAVTPAEVKLKSALGFESLGANPLLRCATSPNQDVVQSTLQLADVGLQFVDASGSVARTPVPVSTLVDSLKKKYKYTYRKAVDSHFTSYVNREGKLPSNQRTVVTDSYGVPLKNNFMNKAQFNEQVSRSLRNHQDHRVPEVREAAKKVREVITEVSEIAIDSGIWDEMYREGLSDSNFLHRVYDTGKIKAFRSDFEEVLKRWFRGEKDLTLDDPDLLNDAVSQVIDNILSVPEGRMHYGPVEIKLRGATHERTLNIPDEMIQDFLVNDIDVIMDRFINTITSDATMKNLTGDVNGKALIQRCTDSWNQKIRQIIPDDPKAKERRAALLKQEQDSFKRKMDVSKDPEVRKKLQERHKQNVDFIEEATPDEILARQRSIENLDRGLAQKSRNLRDKYWEKLRKHAASEAKRSEKKLITSKPKVSDIQGTPEWKKIQSDLQNKIDDIEAARKKEDTSIFPKEYEQELSKIRKDHEILMERLYEEKPRIVRAKERINETRERIISTLDKTDPLYEQRLYDINLEYDGKIDRLYAKDANGVKKIRDAENRRDRDIRDLNAMIGIIRGTLRQNSQSILNAYEIPKLLYTVKTWNHMRSLGQAAITSLPDFAGIVSVQGFTRTIGDIVVPFVTNFHRSFTRFFGNRIGKLLKSDFSLPRNMYEEALEQIRDFGIGNDIVLNHRAKNLSEFGEHFGRSKLERKLGDISQSVSYYSGQSGWNAAISVRAGYMASSSIISAARRFNKNGYISPKTRDYLSTNGIDDNLLRRIGEQFDQFGSQKGRVVIPCTKSWSDRGAAQMFEVVTHRITNSMILNPTLEKPLFFHTPIGSLAGQFKSFLFGAYQRYFLAGLQRRDLATMNGALTMVGLGMCQRVIKDVLINGEVKERSPQEWIQIGVMTSGILGHLTEIDTLIDSATGGILGTDSLVFDQRGSRYNSVERGLTALSPALGLGADLIRTVTGLAEFAIQGENFNSAQLSAFRRLVPYQNTLLFRKFFDMTEDAVRDRINLRPR